VNTFVVRRLLLLVPAWFLLSVVIFSMIHAIPGDPVSVLLGNDPPLGAEEMLRERLGLDQPVYVQYGRWLSGFVRGDLGRSHFLGQSVNDALIARLPVTVALAFLSLAFALLIGIPAGLLAATRANSWVDTGVMMVALVGLSIPDFSLGLFLIFFLSVELGWFPTGGYSPLTAGLRPWLTHLVLPAFSLGFIQAGLIARMTRSSMLEVLSLDYIRSARAKGLPERSVLFRHALKNAIIPVVTVVGTVAASLLGGAFIIETVFNLPGIGNLVVLAIRRRDYALVQAASCSSLRWSSSSISSSTSSTPSSIRGSPTRERVA
jgi:peptide/nickel transport system permease protein